MSTNASVVPPLASSVLEPQAQYNKSQSDNRTAAHGCQSKISLCVKKSVGCTGRPYVFIMSFENILIKQNILWLNV